MVLSWRRILFGRPLATQQTHEHKLPKYLGLPVFASDAISSVAYATEEILLALTLGTGVAASVALRSVFPISASIAVLLAIVVFSYRQTIYAYPNGGGSYIVAKDNLGTLAGLIAGAALMIDYVLTVAVSVAAGVAAIISAFPHLEPYRISLCLGCIALLTIANLRGLKESGTLFMFPTYAFLVCIYTLLVVGLVRYFSGSLGHNPAGPALPGAAGTGLEALSLLLVLRAFSAGCVAMTGTEAISNGVPAFRPPEPKNASITLVWMAMILGTLFLGISFLAWHYGALPDPAHAETVVSVLARGVFDRSWFYYAIQFSTFVLLILAANTPFAGFPRLTMMMANDRFLPRQMANIGDRLVFSNGILLLAVVAGALVAMFGGITHHLIPLYSVGVFLSFTLSQAGMVMRWFRHRGTGWQRNALINGFGALCTGLVLCVVAYTKFASGDPLSAWPLTSPVGVAAVFTLVFFVLISMYHRWMGKWFLIGSTAVFAAIASFWHINLLGKIEIHMGAWVVVVLVPMMVWMFSRIRTHYEEVAHHLTMAGYGELPDFKHTVLLLVPGVHRGMMPAIQYARSIAHDVRGVYVELEPEKTPEIQERWEHYVPGLPLVVVESPYRALLQSLLRYIDQVERERDDDIVTVIIPEFVTEKWWTKILHNQTGLMLKWALLFKKGIVVTNIRYYLEGDPVQLGAHPLTSTREAGDG